MIAETGADHSVRFFAAATISASPGTGMRVITSARWSSGKVSNCASRSVMVSDSGRSLEKVPF